MHDFTLEFFTSSLIGGLTCLIWFTTPGLIALKLLIPSSSKGSISRWFYAPALGMAIFGAFSLLSTSLVSFNTTTLYSSWIVFNLLLLIFAKKSNQLSVNLLFPIPVSHILVIFICCLVYGLIPAGSIFPTIHDEGLYVGYFINDHMKIAFVDSIAREGMPALNPFYTPGGERILLIYYYGWHFVAAQIKIITGITAWQAVVALSWFTSFSLIMFISGLAIKISGKTRAGLMVLPLSMTTQLPEVLPQLVPDFLQALVCYPPDHPLALLWRQLTWAPQHAFSALTVIIALFLVVQLLHNETSKWQLAFLLGLTCAMGVSSSIWVGGVGLLLVSPFLLVACRDKLFPFKSIKENSLPLLMAISICFLCSSPVLTAITSGPTLSNSFPLKIQLYKATALFGTESIFDLLGHYLLYWIKFLPLDLGIIYMVGLLSLFAYKPSSSAITTFKRLSIYGSLGLLLIIQCIRGNIVLNDFGWRCVVVPILLLTIWSAVALADFSQIRNGVTTLWRDNSLLVKNLMVIKPLTYILLVIGIYGSFFGPYDFYIPGPDRSFVQHDLGYHKDFFNLRNAFKEVQKHLEPDELVQINPITFAKIITPWTTPAPVALFANRPTAYADHLSVHVFAHSYNNRHKKELQLMINELFSVKPRRKTIKQLHDIFKIKAIIVHRRDPAWNSNRIVQSGLYSLVETTNDYKIYITSTKGPK